MSEKVIELKNISKKYCFNFGKQSLIRNFLAFFRKSRNKSEVWALKDISFSVRKGEILGIIGENASGKTTILRIISQITVPSSGQVDVKGKVAGLLDLGAGFHPELTGRENIYLDAALYGLSKKNTDALFSEIVEFSGLNQFIDAQVKTYSQGMLVRLGFSVAVHVNPDIFLIDDSLAVGDAEFQAKCLNRIIEMNKQGATVLIVSHDLDSLSRIANQGILLKNGQIIKHDSIDKSIIRYVQAVGEKQAIACLDQGNLSIIFNSGRLVLLWDAKPITADFGGYLSLKLWDKWLMSWQANWQVIKTEKDVFLVQGQWPNHRINAQIQVKLVNEREFECSAKVNIPPDLKVEKAIFGFMLNDQYKHYLDADQMKPISPAGDSAAEQWQDVYRTDQSKALLVLSAGEQAPVVWADFDILDQRGFGLIQTKDKSFDASIIQTQVLVNQEQTVSCKTRIQLLDQKALEEKLVEQKEKGIISKDNLSLKLEQKCFQLFLGQNQISKAKGLSFGFYYQKHFYNIFTGQWKIKKTSAAEFMVNADFPAQRISLGLNLSFKDNAFLVGLKLNSKQIKPEDISGLEMSVDLVDVYKSYFTLNQENDFLAATEFDEKIALKDTKNSFVGLSQQPNGQDNIILKTNQLSQIDLYNTRKDIATRQLRLKTQQADKLEVQIIILEQPDQKQVFILEQRQAFNVENLLANDYLSIDCSQDRLRVFCGTREITALDGFTSGIFFNKRWYESHAVAKTIRKEGNFLYVTMSRKFPDLTEYWEIELKQQRISWNVYLESREKVDDFEYKAGIMLSPEFSQWINAYEQGRFVKDSGEMRIIELKEANSGLLGARTDAAQDSVLLEKNSLPSQKSAPFLQQSGRARVLQFQSGIKSADTDKKKQLVFSAIIKTEKPDYWQKAIDQYCEQNFALVLAEDWKLLAKQHKAELYYQNRLISAAYGLSVSISAYDEFDSFRAQWEIKKLDQNTLFIRISYSNSPFCLNWYFKAEHAAVSWKVELEVFEQVTISAIKVNMFLPKIFKYWQTEQGQGLLELKDQDNDFKSINLLDNRSRYILFGQDDLSAGQSGAIGFAPLIDPEQWLLQMYKPAEKDIIAVESKRLFSEQQLCFKPGKHEIFKADLAMFSGEKQINDFKQKSINKTALTQKQMARGKLKVILEKAKIRLFYADKQLTQGLCLYTGLKSKGKWLDSSQAIWQTEQNTNELKAELFLTDLKCEQTQKIEFISDNEILWQIGFQPKTELIEQIACAIMLSKQFTAWHIGKDKQNSGVFVKQREVDVWEQVADSKSSIAVSSMENKLPKISWESVCSIDSDNTIEDTDKIHNARVLGCKTKTIGQKDKQITFEIKIKLNDQD
jgi:ABC-type polysaccharide/polyol phosphate transport system ATPase subunit